MKQVLINITLCLLVVPALSQVHTEKITKELQFEKKSSANAIMIFNISGDVKVTGYEGDKIVVEVEKVIRAKTDSRLERGKVELQLGVLDRADTVLLYMELPCHTFGRQSRGFRHGQKNSWGYDWNNCCGRGNDCDRIEYDYEMNFTVKVPSGAHVFASTVNNGNVVLENVQGSVHADNVNGSIRLTKIAGPTYASTINGDVDLDYTRNPNGECRYYSLNGDINANFVKGLGAEVAFESFNGNLYSNIDKLETLPATVKQAKGDGIKYKIGGNRFKVGTGGVLLDFETFNGDAYLKEK